jgi:hypothetical protein
MSGCTALSFGQTPSESATGLEGVVRIGPIHSTPAQPNGPSLSPLSEAVLNVSSQDRVVTSFTTDGLGYFRVLLPSGHYTVSLKERKAGIGQCGPFDVDVSAGKITHVDWLCDNSSAVKLVPD